jgi:hypothetical protein
MRVYEFSIVLATSEVSEADCDALYSAGCDDSTIVTRDGVTYLAFDRESQSLEEAIRSAIANVRAAGFDVAKVEMEALAVS